jgi:type VI secretion system secreted protein Hcp
VKKRLNTMLVPLAIIMGVVISISICSLLDAGAVKGVARTPDDVLVLKNEAASSGLDLFLKVDGVKGESRDDRHKEEIVILGYNWGMSQSSDGISGPGKASGAQQVQPQDIVINKRFDKATPQLMSCCASGRLIPSATLALRRTGDTQDYLTIIMKRVTVKAITTGVTVNDQFPLDNLTLSFTEIEVKYLSQSEEKGGAPSETRWGWDFVSGSEGGAESGIVGESGGGIEPGSPPGGGSLPGPE